MLYLKRITDPNEFIWCKVTNTVLQYGDYYYEDDTDKLIISAVYYKQLKDNQKYREYYDTKMNKRSDLRSYTMAMRQAEREFLLDGLLDREIYKGDE